MRDGLRKMFDRIGQTPFMKALGKALGYLPNKLASHISYRKRQSLWGLLFVLPSIIGLVYFFLIPFFVTVIYSFSRVENQGTVATTGKFIGVATEWIGLDNFKYLFKEHATFAQTLFNAFGNTIINTFLILIFSLIVAVLLNSKFRGRAFVRAMFFMPVIFNSQAVDVAMTTGSQLQSTIDATNSDVFTMMFNFADFLTEANIPTFAVGFLSTTTKSIYNIISYSGIQILIFLAGIQSVPKHLYEAAKIEGATQYEIFWKITFPMVSPLMLTAGVYTVVDSFMRSELLKTINVYQQAGNISLLTGLGDISHYGIHASMSLLFAVSSLAAIGIVLFILSRVVFYYDE